MARFVHLKRVCVATLLCLGLGAQHASAKDSASAIPYRVRIRGVRDKDLAREMKAVSDAMERVKSPPASELQLRRRLDADVDRFQRVLRAHGYYRAAVTTDIDMDRRPARIRFRIDKGEPYRLREIRLVSADAGSAGPEPPDPADIGLSIGAVARANVVLRAEERLAQDFQRRGYPFTRIENREIHVEHATRAMDVTFVYEPGPFATFGRVTITGAPSVRESYVRGKMLWAEGEPYNGDQVALARRRLAGTDLFASVRVAPEPDAEPDPALPMRVDVVERKPRTLGFGAGYRSDEGARARLSWEHRNLFGAGERFHIGASVSEIGFGGEMRFSRFDFKRNDQTLSLLLRAAQEDTDAFHSRNAGALLGLDRLFSNGITGGLGLGYKYSEVRDDGSDPLERFGLVYVPVRWDWDRSDNWLDPRRGWRWSSSFAPYTDTLGSGLAFVKARAGYTRYARLTRRPELDWAGRLAGGVLFGASRDAVPADERFYAGGGGSVRGYGYQMAGELDDKKPKGGTSMVLASSELRWRITREIGAVVFADGGTASASGFPESDELFWAAGWGARYFTPVGPLRLDMAFPLDRRAGVDKPYQFYISLGQAF